MHFTVTTHSHQIAEYLTLDCLGGFVSKVAQFSFSPTKVFGKPKLTFLGYLKLNFSDIEENIPVLFNNNVLFGDFSTLTFSLSNVQVLGVLPNSVKIPVEIWQPWNCRGMIGPRHIARPSQKKCDIGN